jgi:alpha-beta hydrolase superfamily lysophospholipase
MLGLDTPARARESMFSPATPESLILRYLVRFQQESQRALYLDMTFRALPRPHHAHHVSAPLLVLGAERDSIVTTEEVHATGTAYRTAAEIFPDIGHDLMLEPGWDVIAQRIHAWIETLAPMRQSPRSREQVADQ